MVKPRSSAHKGNTTPGRGGEGVGVGPLFATIVERKRTPI